MARPGAAETVFQAIADPTRRAILQLLGEGEQTVSELVAPFASTQPAISQHLKVLREAGLVRDRRAGRQRIYRLEPGPLQEVVDWCGYFERFWPERLEKLRSLLEED
jgi:DNA-binding transcriptional ArsR family regulator